MEVLMRDMPAIFEHAYNYRRRIILHMRGDPGIGKTSFIHEFAAKKGKKVVTFILSLCLPSEVSGIRMPDLEKGELVVLDDAKMASLEDGDILFFDEFCEASPQLWSTVLTLFNDRMMASGRKLPDVMIVAASNKTVTEKQIPDNVKNRFVWVDVKFDWETWSSWFEGEYKVRPVSQLRDMIGTRAGYNLITPRTITDLYGWCAENEFDLMMQKVIKDTFGTFMWDRLYATSMNASAKRQLIDAVDELNIELPPDWEKMDIEELAQVLMSHERWDEIAAALKEVSVREEEVLCMS